MVEDLMWYLAAEVVWHHFTRGTNEQARGRISGRRCAGCVRRGDGVRRWVRTRQEQAARSADRSGRSAARQKPDDCFQWLSTSAARGNRQVKKLIGAFGGSVYRRAAAS